VNGKSARRGEKRQPDEWVVVQQDISDIIERGIAQELKVNLERLSSSAAATSSHSAIGKTTNSNPFLTWKKIKNSPHW
jgi:hypothetical protein